MKRQISQETIQIGITKTEKEKNEIYRLRYQIYVEEMSWQVVSIDHSKKLLFDELDDWGILLYAKVGEEIIGTLRINIGTITDFPLHKRHILSLDRFQKFYKNNQPANFAYSSILMVTPPYRNSMASYLLLEKGYEIYCNHQVQFSFCVCGFHLLRFYEQLGTRRFGKNFIDPDYGILTPVVLLVDDIEYLRMLRSPFWRLARKRKIINSEVRKWFYGQFTETSDIINSQLVSEDELWIILCNRLGNCPNQAIPILNGLSIPEAKKFLHSSVIARCQKGDHIIKRSYVSHTLNILISGKIKPSNSNRIMPGQHLGAAGLYGQPRHREDIFASTNIEMLVFSRVSFPKFNHLYPTISQKVLQNLSILTSNNLDALHF